MAISQYPAGSQGTPGEYGNFTRHGVENAALYKARAVGDHATKLGACKALRERRYTPYFGVCHFNDSLFGSAAYRRARLSPPLQRANSCLAQLRIFVKMYLTFREQADIIKMWKPRRLPQT